MPSTTTASFIERCATCTLPTTNKCSGCKDTPTPIGIISSIYYCTPACQKASWKEHKKECSARKTRLVVFRTGEVLQELFYTYREKMFDKEIARLEEKGGELLVHDGKYGKERNLGEYIKTFPEKVVRSEEERRILLAHLACSDIPLYMENIIEYVLGDLTSKITVVPFKVKNVARRVVAIACNGERQNFGNNGEHSVIILDLKNGESYVLDLAGAQFGWSEVIMPRTEYFARRAERFLPGAGPLSSVKEAFGCLPVLLPQLSAIIKNNEAGSKCLLQTVQDWEKEGGNGDLREMCRGEHKEFLAKKADLLASFEKKMRDFVKGYKEKCGKL